MTPPRGGDAESTPLLRNERRHGEDQEDGSSDDGEQVLATTLGGVIHVDTEGIGRDIRRQG